MNGSCRERKALFLAAAERIGKLLAFTGEVVQCQQALDPKANLPRIGKSHFNTLDSQIGSAPGFEDFEIQVSRLLCASGQMYDCNTIAGCCAPDLAFPSKVGPGF